MNVVLFGASGMIGAGVLLECLDSDRITSVRTVGRRPTGIKHDKLREISHDDFLDFSAIEDELGDLDACLWCLGISSSGMSEADYTRITYDYTKAAAETLLRLNPGMAMCFVSGASTDGTEKGRVMWARVKGKTENLLLGMGFSRATMFRPGFIRPMRGVKSRTKLYNTMYVVLSPIVPVIGWMLGDNFTTTITIGKAMIKAAESGAPKPVLEAPDINALLA